mmetsp:Transcript_15003/g.30950  ORF Transcript_15003/g.30950 Transcript_15003/m.30950 type:complete len:93 (-) Transcript_15003:752-1030(-)
MTKNQSRGSLFDQVTTSQHDRTTNSLGTVTFWIASWLPQSHVHQENLGSSCSLTYMFLENSGQEFVFDVLYTVKNKLTKHKSIFSFDPPNEE